MRLIDADALKEKMFIRKFMVGRHSDADCLLEDAPTVKAVPVSWIEKMMLEGEPEDSKAAWRVLREWKKGREGTYEQTK